MSNFAQPRQPKGVPAGGQFAPVARPAASVSLTDEPRSPKGRGAALSPERCREALSYARVAARYWCGRLGIHDVDEIVGRTMLAALTQHAPGGVRDLRGYLHHLAKGMAMAYTSGGNRAVRRAQAVLAMEMERYAQANAHWPTPSERAGIAADVRLGFSGGRRPPRDYDARQVLRLRGPGEDGEVVEPPGAAPWGQAGPEERASPAVEDALDDVEAALTLSDRAERARAKSALRSQIWAVLAPNGPGLRPVASSTAGAARKLVREAGGAYAVARAYLLGEASRDLAEALFAPFEASAEAQRLTVATTLRRHRPHAQALWSEALRAARTKARAVGA
jgi:hypothetical protein